MHDILLTGIITLIGVSIGGIFTLWATNLTQKNEQKTKELQNLISQWENFYEIEKELISKIVELDNTQNAHILKKEIRASICSRDFKELDVPSRIKTLKKTWK
jgi:poly(3-hydroxyalkanoate) synthetase